MPNTHIQNALGEAASALAWLMSDSVAMDRIAQASQILVGAFRSSHRVYSCGNGGSICDAMHFAEELSGRFRKDRPGLPALAITDVGHITCTANDFGYDRIFARFIESHAQKGDVLVVLSTSGKSPNTIVAAEAARDKQMKVISLTGREGSPLGALADCDICTPVGVFSDRVQELHIKILHILVELVERDLFPYLYD